MRNYVLRRIAMAVPIMLGVSFLTFVAFRIIPGDIVDIRCGFSCDEETREVMRHQLGLDRPWYVQYLDWVWGVVRGDFGQSLGEGQLSVSTELGRRMPITLELMVMTVFLTVLIGVPLGVLAAVRPNTPFDFTARMIGVLGLSVPNFYLALLVIIFGAAWFSWSPPQFGTGRVAGLLDDPWANVQAFFFPSLVLAFGSAAVIMRLLRSALLDVLRNDYIRTAWSKGLRERSVIFRHALKNALIPVLTFLGLEVGGLIGGSVIMESIFALNGVGSYILYSIVTRDIVVVQSVVLLIALAYVTINLIVDVLYGWLDPRVRIS